MSASSNDELPILGIVDFVFPAQTAKAETISGKAMPEEANFAGAIAQAS